MMKTTPWKEYTEHGQRYRIQATYGIDYDFGRRHHQSPSFSATATVEVFYRGHWKEYSGGMQHGEIARHFPDLEPYLKWHLVSLGEPMHYIANAQYWWEKMNGTSRWPDEPGGPDPKNAFLHTIIFGGIPGETLLDTNFWIKMESWLRQRLPKLMGYFAADMKTLGVLE
jgi:hypothetical protein